MPRIPILFPTNTATANSSCLHHLSIPHLPLGLATAVSPLLPIPWIYDCSVVPERTSGQKFTFLFGVDLLQRRTTLSFGEGGYGSHSVYYMRVVEGIKKDSDTLRPHPSEAINEHDECTRNFLMLNRRLFLSHG